VDPEAIYEQYQPTFNCSFMGESILQDSSKIAGTACDGLPIKLSDSLFGIQPGGTPSKCESSLLAFLGLALDPRPGQGSTKPNQTGSGGLMEKDLIVGQACNPLLPMQNEDITTAMVRNLPGHLKQTELLKLIDATGFVGLVDFCNAPSTFNTNKNKGYAFVNFLSSEAFDTFITQWQGKRYFNICEPDPALNVSAAALQGFDRNVERWTGAKMRRIRNSDFRPFVTNRVKTQSTPAAWNANEVAVQIPTPAEWLGFASEPAVLPVSDFLFDGDSSDESPLSEPLKATPLRSALLHHMMPPPGLSLHDDSASFWAAGLDVMPPPGLPLRPQ